MDDPYTSSASLIPNPRIKGDIPIQRNRHSPKPSTHARPQRSAPNRVGGPSHAPDLPPGAPVDAVDVDQRRGGKNGHVRCTEDGLEVVRCERGAEEDKED